MNKYRKLENLEIDSSTYNTAINPRYRKGVFRSVINWAQLTVIGLLKSIRNLIDLVIAKIVSKESNVGNSKDLLVHEEAREMEAIEKTLDPRLPSYEEAIKGCPPTYEETLNDKPPTYEETLKNDEIKANKKQLDKWQKSGELKGAPSSAQKSKERTSKLVEIHNFQANSNKRSVNVADLEEHMSKRLKTQDFQANSNKRSANVADLEEHMSKRLKTQDFQANSNKRSANVADLEERMSKRLKTQDFQANPKKGSANVAGFDNESGVSPCRATRSAVTGMPSEESVRKWLEAQDFQANPNKGSANVAGLDGESSVSPCRATRSAVTSMPSEESVRKWLEAQDFQAQSNKGSASVADSSETESVVSSKAGSIASLKVGGVDLWEIENIGSYETESFHSCEAESIGSWKTESFHSCETESVLSLTPEPVEKVWLTARPLRAFVNFVMRPFRATEVVKDSIVRLEEGSIHLDCETVQERVPTPTPPCEEITRNIQLKSVAPSAGAERLQKAQAEGIPGQHERSVLQDVRLSRLRDPKTAKKLIDIPFMRP